MYNPTKWKDHVTDPKNEYIIEQIEGDRYKITPCGEIIERGTLLSAENFNKVEKGLSEAVTALGALLHKTKLNDDEMAKISELVSQVPLNFSETILSVLSNFIFVTEEKTVNESAFVYSSNAIAKRISFTFKFDTQNRRQNTDYFAIPFITGTSFKENADGCNDYAHSLLMHLDEESKTVESFRIDVMKPDLLSYIGEYKFRVLIIGGV